MNELFFFSGIKAKYNPKGQQSDKKSTIFKTRAAAIIKCQTVDLIKVCSTCCFNMFCEILFSNFTTP